MNTSQQIFIATDTEVAATATEVDGTDFTSRQIKTKFARTGILTCYVDGSNAGSSGNVVFTFVCYDPIRTTWDTVAYVTVTCALNGTTAVQKSITFYPDMYKLKLLSIANADTTYKCTANASITMKERS